MQELSAKDQEQNSIMTVFIAESINLVFNFLFITYSDANGFD
ncbi:hypothetical protein [Flavobacterium petrolei]